MSERRTIWALVWRLPSQTAPSFLRFLRLFAAKPGPARFPIRGGAFSAEYADGSGDKFREPTAVRSSRLLKLAALSRDAATHFELLLSATLCSSRVSSPCAELNELPGSGWMICNSSRLS